MVSNGHFKAKKPKIMSTLFMNIPLDELKSKFKKVDVTTVIQCNGNRREDFHYFDDLTPAFGPPHWVSGAIGNATWSGPRLRDVLKECGMDVDNISLGNKKVPKTWNVGLLGYDQDEVGNQYCCSFPFDKAVDPFGDVILAYEMNGEPIPRSHGFPVRAIVPGNVQNALGCILDAFGTHLGCTEIWDGFGMDLGWIWDGFGVDLGWTWDGLGMDVHRMDLECT